LNSGTPLTKLLFCKSYTLLLERHNKSYTMLWMAAPEWAGRSSRQVTCTRLTKQPPSFILWGLWPSRTQRS